MLFDKIQRQYNELLARVYPGEKGYTIPDNGYFDKLKDENKKKVLDERAKKRMFKGLFPPPLWTKPFKEKKA